MVFNHSSTGLKYKPDNIPFKLDRDSWFVTAWKLFKHKRNLKTFKGSKKKRSEASLKTVKKSRSFSLSIKISLNVTKEDAVPSPEPVNLLKEIFRKKHCASGEVIPRSLHCSLHYTLAGRVIPRSLHGSLHFTLAGRVIPRSLHCSLHFTLAGRDIPRSLHCSLHFTLGGGSSHAHYIAHYILLSRGGSSHAHYAHENN
ncbi:hypothetical protein RhiirC2_824369 [Rhizophagus irregularis]|uniref:Uncharacterized protein n=1 Tax=Rhizophagus irregularis TaxID=588596 RepID=A0A2N1M8H7_9GLOM|nr:hypothetical protein RhiirC2_824369 [Rhizophagus irregularis]